MPTLAHRDYQGQAIITLHNVLPVIRNGETVKYVTAINVADVAEYVNEGKVIVDYDYQRGVKILRRKNGAEVRIAMVDMNRVRDMFYKIVSGEFYGGALTWNLRDEEVEYHYDSVDMILYIVKGTPTIPDSNHRHQACREVLKAYREGKLASFEPTDYEFPLVIEKTGIEGEAALFYEYNQLARPANATRAKFLQKRDPVNRMTGCLSEETFLDKHVEVVLNSISKNSSMIVTFNALASAIEKAYRDELNEPSEEEFEKLKSWLVRYLNYLATVLPELNPCSVAQRQRIREQLIIDSSIAFNAYLSLSTELRGRADWEQVLARLAQPYQYTEDGKTYTVPFFSRDNPLWKQGVLLVKVDEKTGRPKMSLQNSRASVDFLERAVFEHCGLMA